MSRLLDEVRDRVRALHDSIRTEDAYVTWARRFILFHGKRHPEEMGAPELEAFLTHLAVKRKVAASTQNQARSAILFLYREVVGRPLEELGTIAPAKRPERLPTVLTREEVRGLPAQLEGSACGMLGPVGEVPRRQVGRRMRGGGQRMRRPDGAALRGGWDCGYIRMFPAARAAEGRNRRARDGRAMAHKKGQGSSRNGRDSNPQHLGIKLFGGQYAKPGSIICRQRGTKWHAGKNVGLGRDYTIYSLVEGTVKFDQQGRRINVVPLVMAAPAPASSGP